MDKEAKGKVAFKPRAEKSIVAISIYIASKGYPETARKFKDKLYEFGVSLSLLPLKYPVCNHPVLAKNNLHCAVFHKKFIFVYKIIKKHLVIYNVIHTLTNPAFHSA